MQSRFGSKKLTQQNFVKVFTFVMQHVFALMIDEQHCSDPIDLLQDDFTVRYSRRLSVARNILISFIEQTCKILKIDFKVFEEIHQKKLLDN